MLKKCAKCNLNKSKDCFHKQKVRKDGLSPYCKQCVATNYRLKHPIRVKKTHCKDCKINLKFEDDSYCYECRKKRGRDNYHKKRVGIEKKPQHKFKDLTGLRYGRLLVIRQMPRNSKFIRWECLCDCGNYTYPITSQLNSNNCRSCGCLQKDKAKEHNTRHGMTNTSEFGIWYTMKRRCNDPKVKNYNIYGGRGIKVCNRWMECFENFYEDMGPRPSEEHSIERLDTNGNYCPENCIWGTEEIQSRNRRNNVKVTINGVTKLMIDWAKDYGVDESLVRSRRAKGWSLNETIFTVPKHTRK
jgi:hypothetical protein